MNSRTLAAIAGCTRTLGEAPDDDEPVTGVGFVTIGPLRAHADRLALRRRFHTPALHAHHRPDGGAAPALYDALELARLDALGARWLAGIACNLLAYPGIDDDGVRWLAFEALSGMDAPAEKRDLLTRVRAALPADLAVALRELAALVGDHAAFAEAAARWSRRAAGAALPARLSMPQRQFEIPTAPTGVDARHGRYALPGRTRTAADEPPASSHAADTSRPPRDAVAPLAGYRVFSRDFDRVVNAAALASPDELAELRRQLDADFTPLRAMVARMAKRLMRVLMAQQTREWRFDLDEGLIEPSRLAPFVASRGAARPFKQEFASPFPSTVVTLLIDHSGSMAGRPMRIAALTVEVFARVLERCGVRCEVLGFTTRDWDGGEVARLWADAGYPPEPGRLNALEHIVIKAADVPWRRARRALGLFLRHDRLKENIDGEALAWAHERLLARPERRRILIVISDGTPMDEATFAANGFDYLDAHLAAMTRDIETRSPVTLAAIGIGHDVSQFYSHATRISKIEDLGAALTGELLKVLKGAEKVPNGAERC